MKLLLLLVALGFCSASLENKRVLVGEDGNVAISNSYGRVISITKPFGPGGKTIEIDVSGPYVPTKRIYVDNTNGVEVQGGYPGYGLGGQFWNSVYQGQYPLGQYQLGQYSQGYPNVYGQNQGGVPIVGQGEYGSQYPEGSSYLYPEHQGYSQQSSVPVSSWWRRYLNPYTQQHQLGQGVYQGAEQYLGNLQGGYQSEYPYGQWQGQYPVWGQHGVQGGIEQQGQYYQPSSYLWRRLLSPVERQRIQQYVWGRLGQVQGVLGQGYPSIWNGLLSGSGLSGQQGQGVYGGIGQYVTPQVVV